MIEIPVRIESVSNLREHWSKRAARAKVHRETACLALTAALHGARVPLPCTVKLTRTAPRKLDGDNLQSALKATRDGVADWFGIKDDDPRVNWEYDQVTGPPKVFTAWVEFKP